jgi:hypothetical protein
MGVHGIRLGKPIIKRLVKFQLSPYMVSKPQKVKV